MKTILYSSTSDEFCQLYGSNVSPTYRPHSNKCGPRTLLALTAMASHPFPHCNMLLPYMNDNLAQQAQLWMAILLLTGSIPLLPPMNQESNFQLQFLAQTSKPSSIIDWNTPYIPLVSNISETIHIDVSNPLEANQGQGLRTTPPNQADFQSSTLPPKENILSSPHTLRNSYSPSFQTPNQQANSPLHSSSNPTIPASDYGPKTQRQPTNRRKPCLSSQKTTPISPQTDAETKRNQSVSALFHDCKPSKKLLETTIPCSIQKDPDNDETWGGALSAKH